MTWTAKKDEVIATLDEISELIGKLRSQADHIFPEEAPPRGNWNCPVCNISQCYLWIDCQRYREKR